MAILSSTTPPTAKTRSCVLLMILLSTESTRGASASLAEYASGMAARYACAPTSDATQRPTSLRSSMGIAISLATVGALDRVHRREPLQVPYHRTC